MTVTTRHPSSRFGVPVILDEEGRVQDTCLALKFFRRYYGMTAEDFAQMCNATIAQVNSWENRRIAVPVNVLNVMRDFLEDEKERVMRGGLRITKGQLRQENLLRKRLRQGS